MEAVQLGQLKLKLCSWESCDGDGGRLRRSDSMHHQYYQRWWVLHSIRTAQRKIPVSGNDAGLPANPRRLFYLSPIHDQLWM